MTPLRLREIHKRARDLVQQNSPEERTLLARYILELIEVLGPEFQAELTPPKRPVVVRRGSLVRSILSGREGKVTRVYRLDGRANVRFQQGEETIPMDISDLEVLD